MNYWTLSPRNIFVAAHRGWSARYPENTMAAFRAALSLGVDQIETDIRVTKDGTLVLMHDEAVDRTTDGTGLVREKTFAELRALDAGIRKGPAFAGERVPTLIELMELIRDEKTLTMDFELKEYPTEGREDIAFRACDEALGVIEEYGYADRCVINSFSGRLNEYVHEKYGKRFRQHVYFPRDVMSECAIDPYSYAYCCCMFEKGKTMADKTEFDAMAARGVQPWAGAAVKDDATVTEAIGHGAYLITCNNPDEVLRLLREKGCHA